ncbi:MAG: hypothetical protein AAB581_02295 [Patescibacteria group bacterium]
MSEQQRTQVVLDVFKLFREIAEEQIILIKSAKRDTQGLDSRHHFIFATTLSFWRDADFALSLYGTQWDFYAFYPIRTMMEKLLKMGYFNTLSEEAQNQVWQKESLLVTKRHYDMSGDQKLYNKIRGNFPSVEAITEKELKVFPHYEELCRLYSNSKISYYWYRWLSGMPHGNLAFLLMHETLKDSEFRRCIHMGGFFGYEMLRVVDVHFANRHLIKIESTMNSARKVFVDVMGQSQEEAMP